MSGRVAKLIRIIGITGIVLKAMPGFAQSLVIGNETKETQKVYISLVDRPIAYSYTPNKWDQEHGWGWREITLMPGKNVEIKFIDEHLDVETKGINNNPLIDHLKISFGFAYLKAGMWTYDHSGKKESNHVDINQFTRIKLIDGNPPNLRIVGADAGDGKSK